MTSTDLAKQIDHFPHEPQRCIATCAPSHHEFGGFHCIWCKQPWPCSQLMARALVVKMEKDGE